MNILIPISWLRDYLKTDVSAKTIREQLSLSGPSIEREEKHVQDTIFDVEVTSNRPDAYSVYGLARETAAILSWSGAKSNLVSPNGISDPLTPQTKQLLKLAAKVEPKLCPRFTAIILDNIKIAPSPAIIKNRLEAVGIRQINNIVDIGNYVMLELGNPMHMFDYDKIKGAKMILRESRKGESIRTLDGQNHKLPEGTIVIEDAERLMDLCGIMGGENSAVSTRTKRVLLFVQAYDPIKIRKTTQALAIRTDAATRFEKGIDLESIPRALSRAVYLCKKYASAKVASELIDIYPNKQQSKTIELPIYKLSNYLGIDLPLPKAAQILKSLGFTVEIDQDALTAKVPHWRMADMDEDVDLIEEIARIYGYHNLPSSLPQGDVPNEPETDLSRVIELKKALKYLGLIEVISYSIISKDWLKLTGVEPLNAVELANPLSSEWQFMRPSIIPSLASIIAQNQNLKQKIKIFEIAKTYLPDNQGSTLSSTRKNLDQRLPIQDLKLAIVLQNSDFYQIKGLVENVFEILASPVELKKLEMKGSSSSASERLNFEPLFEINLSATAISSAKTIGIIGILNQNVANRLGIDGTTAIAEINLSTVYSLPTTTKSFHSIPKFPPVIEDISAIFDQKTPVADIVSAIKNSGKPLVKSIEIIDVYEDIKIGKDKKSVTLRLQFQKSDSTPTTEEITPIRESIIKHLESKLSAQVRR